MNAHIISGMLRPISILQTQPHQVDQNKKKPYQLTAKKTLHHLKAMQKKKISMQRRCKELLHFQP